MIYSAPHSVRDVLAPFYVTQKIKEARNDPMDFGRLRASNLSGDEIELLESMGIRCNVPLQGLRLGQQMTWYARES